VEDSRDQADPVAGPTQQRSHRIVHKCTKIRDRRPTKTGDEGSLTAYDDRCRPARATRKNRSTTLRGWRAGTEQFDERDALRSTNALWQVIRGTYMVDGEHGGGHEHSNRQHESDVLDRPLPAAACETAIRIHFATVRRTPSHV
jgi:hypothetical protein